MNYKALSLKGALAGSDQKNTALDSGKRDVATQASRSNLKQIGFVCSDFFAVEKNLKSLII